MKSKKAVRSALGMSVLSIALCAAMLIGTTFAWFTDTASTAVNKIQAGTLDVALEMNEGTKETPKWVSAEGKTLDFVKSPNAPAGEELLWEPGCTYNLPQLRVVNNGNLALKYMIKFTGIKGDAKLNDAIVWTVTNTGDSTTGDSSDVVIPATDTQPAQYKLLPQQTAHELTISGHMKEEAGNEYQGLSIDGIAITVYATQYTYESDSKDNQYDKDSAYKGSQTITSGTHILDKGGVVLATDTFPVAVFAGNEGTNVTITGGYYDGGSGGDYNVCVWANNGANVTIKGGTFTVGTNSTNDVNSVIYSTGGNITIEGGFFYTQCGPEGYKYILNQNNGNPGTITVKGGTFVNYDPSKGDDNLHGNFVAEGYSVLTQVQPNGDIWYTVVNGKAAGSQEDLKDVIGNLGENGGNVTLGSGIYTLYNVNNNTKNTTLTLEGAGADKTTFTAGDLTVTDANGEGSSDYSYEGSDVTFKNMTINVGTGNYKGFVRANALYFENCTIVGRGSYWGSGTVVFKNCTFKNDGDYNIWTYAGKDFTFDNCEFVSNIGKFVNAYKEQRVDSTLKFTNCKFTNTGNIDKPAVCLKSYTGIAWDVTFSNCTTQNAATDSTTNSDLYSIESGMNTDTIVTINSVVAWENGTKVQ